MRTPFALIAASVLTASCGSKEGEIANYASFVKYVQTNRVGQDNDDWIEMKNMAGEWEKTALVFGYIGDYDECVKAIAGLKRANPNREYRCVPAN